MLAAFLAAEAMEQLPVRIKLQKIMLGLFPTFCNKNYVISCLRNWTPKGLNSPFLPTTTLIDFADPGFVSESIQSVICVPSFLQNLPKTTLPSIPFLFKF